MAWEDYGTSEAEMRDWKWPWFNNGHVTYVTYRRNNLMPDGDPVPVECPYRGFKRFAYQWRHTESGKTGISYVWVESAEHLLTLLNRWTGGVWQYTVPVDPALLETVR